VTASKTDASAGTYSVTLTVTDNNGATNSVTNSVTVTAPTTNPNELVNGVAKTGLSASQGNVLNYTMNVPAGANFLSFAISGGTGDADIYVRFGAAPTTNNYDCRPYISGNNETCNINTAQVGTYYIMVRAYSTFSGVSLTGSYSTGGSTGQVFSSTTNVNIPDNNPTGATSNIVVDRTGPSNNLRITYNIIHTYIGDLKVELIDPTGAVTVLRSNTGGSANDINEFKNINKGSTTATGTWGLRVIDSAAADTGYINSWSIEFL
jgi:serine protease